MDGRYWKWWKRQVTERAQEIMESEGIPQGCECKLGQDICAKGQCDKFYPGYEPGGWGLLDDPKPEAPSFLATDGVMLTFTTGATRNRKENELAYEGFLHPVVLKRFAEYMHKHRVQADGVIRDPDNWQKGMPDESYMDSLLRHVMDLWLIHRGYADEARESWDDALAATLFNTMGLMFNSERD